MLSMRLLCLQAVKEKSGKDTITFSNSMVNPKTSLWTCSIDTAQ